MHKLRCKQEWCPLSFNLQFLFEISQKVTKVDMEKHAVFCYHSIA